MIYYFILGILFIDILLPIMEGITGCICTRMEQYKAKCAVKINEYNAQIEEGSMPIADSYPIGFQYIPAEEEFEEEFDD